MQYCYWKKGINNINIKKYILIIFILQNRKITMPVFMAVLFSNVKLKSFFLAEKSLGDLKASLSFIIFINCPH